MKKVFSVILFSIFVVYPFGQLTRISNLLNFPEVALSLLDILVVALVGFWFFIRKKQKLEIPPVLKPGIYFLFVAFLSLLLNYFHWRSHEFFVASLYLLRLTAYFSYSLALFEYGNKFENRETFLLIVGLFTAIFGFVQLIFWPDLKVLESFEWDPHYYRLAGTLLDPSFTGIILASTLIIALVKLRERRNSRLIITSLVVALGLIFTQSRASWLSFFAAFTLFSILKRTWKAYLLAMILSAFFVWLMPKPAGEAGKLVRTYSVETRIGSWNEALQIAKNYPVFGVGFNAYRYARHQYGFDTEKWLVSHAGAGADSSFLFVLATTGVLGLTVYLYWWYVIIRESWQKRGTQAGLILLLTAVAVITHSFFNNTLFYPWVMVWFFTLMSA